MEMFVYLETDKVKAQIDEAVEQASMSSRDQERASQGIDNSLQKAQRMRSRQFIRQGRKSIFRSLRNIPAVYRSMRTLGKGRLPSIRDTIKSVYGAYRIGRGMTHVSNGAMGIPLPNNESTNVPSFTQITDPQDLNKSYLQTKELAQQLSSAKENQQQLLQRGKENAQQAQYIRQETRVQQAEQGTKAFFRSGITMASGVLDSVKGHSIKGTLKGMLAVSDMAEGAGLTLKATLGHLADVGASMQDANDVARQEDAVAQTAHSLEDTVQQQAVLERLLQEKVDR